MKVKMTKRIKHGSNLFEAGEVYTVGAITGSEWVSKGYCEEHKEEPKPKAKKAKKEEPKIEE